MVDYENIYTRSERTVRKYTVYQAVQLALWNLRRCYPNMQSVCTNALRGAQDSDKITLAEMNRLAEAMVMDTMYWSY